MMRNPEATKERILKQSGNLFNTRGYKATSISDITKATGYTKGAIYRHFKSKSDLEIETLNHLSGVMYDKLRDKIKAQPNAREKLKSIFQFFETYVSKPPIKGGCPLMNVAIEADDAHPNLRKRAVSILNGLRDSVLIIVANGQRHGQVKKDINAEHFATIVIAGLEGAIMMSKLRGNDDDIVRMIAHLNQMTEDILI